MHPIIEKLRHDYPVPVPAYGRTSEDYCIGGALCMTYGTREQSAWRRFPPPLDLSDVLRALNKHLDNTTAYDFAVRITHNNDTQCFERAYTVLDQALTYTKETP